MSKKTAAKKSPKLKKGPKLPPLSQPNPAPEPQPEPAPSNESSISSNPGTFKPEPISQADLDELNRIPESVPNDVPEVDDLLNDFPASQPGGAPAPGDPTGLVTLAENATFDEEDVTFYLSELFSWLGIFFKSDHWELSERQARMLGRPGAVLVNALWQKLMEKLPDAFGKWCSDTPGAMAFFMALAAIAGPRAYRQWEIYKERQAIPQKPTQQQEQARAAATQQPAKPVAPAQPQPKKQTAEARAPGYPTDDIRSIPTGGGTIGGSASAA